MKSKDSKEFLKGSWIVELGELSAMKRTEVEEIKGFLSVKSDRYRPSYGRLTVDNPRTCVFIGTTNDLQFLKDVSGNRRFYPIPIDAHERKLDVFTMNSEIVQQIWAEAYANYLKGEEIYMSDILEKTAEEYRGNAMTEDPILDRLNEYLDMLLPTFWNETSLENKRMIIKDTTPVAQKYRSDCYTVRRDTVTTKEIMTELFGHDPQDDLRGRGYTKTVSSIMNNHTEWTPSTHCKDMNGKDARGYKRIVRGD